MVGKNTLIFFLFVVSNSAASLPELRFIFRQSHVWSVNIYTDGSAMMLYGSMDRIDTPPNSFDLNKIGTELGPLVITNPGHKKGVQVYSSLMEGRKPNTTYYTEKIEYVRELVKEVFEKSQVMHGNVERFDKWLVKEPPLGLDLYFDEDQILRREDYSGPPLRLRKPPPWFTRVVKRYPVLGEYPVVPELFSTPWPYLAMLALLALVLRRYRLNRRNKLANS